MASGEDPCYKQIMAGKTDSFWQIHETNHPPGFYSEDFKDLMTFMFQPWPTNRLSFADIVGHPWVCNYATADASEVRQEFA